MKLTPALIALAVGMISANSAHAERYCKSVDRSGNASYTLAPATGCKKQFKTVGVSQFKSSTSTPTTTTTTQTATTTSSTTEKMGATTVPVVATTPITTPATDGMPVTTRSPAAKINPENQ